MGIKVGSLTPLALKLNPDIAALNALRSQSPKPLIRSAKTPDSFFPIKGVMNPYPPYASPNGTGAADNTYRNAVSGDFDLFAVWPRCPRIGIGDLVRMSEVPNASIAPAAPPDRVPVFLEVAEKAFAVQLNGSRNIYVELIPSPAELARREHPSFGNANDAVLLAAGTLNSFVTLEYLGLQQKETPNAAFHSDEGGRPDARDIGFPVAMFLPDDPNLLFTPQELGPTPVPAEKLENARVYLITQASEFLEIIWRLRTRCNILLHVRWLIDLLDPAKTPDPQGRLIDLLVGPQRDSATVVRDVNGVLQPLL